MTASPVVDYERFLASKRHVADAFGFDAGELNPKLFQFQKDIVRWATRRGRACVWADCGLGKTPMQLEWARLVCGHDAGNVLILAPLAVAKQTKREGEKFGIPVTVCRAQADAQPGINVTNYEMLGHFDRARFRGLVLDESSCIKDHTSKTRAEITEFVRDIHYRLACTATPAPNDLMELTTHAELMGVMTRAEMLATFFCHDGVETSKWRLKKHAEEAFWKWVASWAVLLRKPSDLGYEDAGFSLPPLEFHEHVVKADWSSDYLFPVEAKSLLDRRRARRDSLSQRVELCADLVNASKEPWVIWCDLNDESAELTHAIIGAAEIKGADSREHKERTVEDFALGRLRVIVSKPSICGWGLNWQHCRNMAFVGLSDSYEALYQATRRCWRFGQEKRVNVHIITGELEGAVVANIKRKEAQAQELTDGMLAHMRAINTEMVHGQAHRSDEYKSLGMAGDSWEMWLGDCVERSREIASDSVHYSIYSPPFASLYTYTSSERDMGNTRGDDQFLEHYRFLVRELYRILMPGRLLSFHCMNLPQSKELYGEIGIRDFRGELIRVHAEAGFIFHSEVCIWKNPVTAMHRTKALGLLHKQVRKDSCMSRQGIPDYLVTMRKPGVNPEPVAGMFDRYIGENGTGPASTDDPTRFSIEVWQRYASPVWMDIDAGYTLQRKSAREEEDERHICPLQLGVIERALELWTNEGDIVLSPFAGIGSEGYIAVKNLRRFLGIELKESYWKQACLNLRTAESERTQLRLIAEPPQNRPEEWMAALGAQDAIHEEALEALGEQDFPE